MIKVEKLNPILINTLDWISTLTLTNEHHYKTKEIANYAWGGG